MKVIVYHTYYGCDTGCCGHAVRIKNEEEWKSYDSFKFSHPDKMNDKEWAIEFAKEYIKKRFGSDHTFDLLWGECTIIDD